MLNRCRAIESAKTASSGRTLASASEGSMLASSRRTAGSVVAASHSGASFAHAARTTMLMNGYGICDTGTYAAGTASASSDVCLTLSTTPMISRDVWPFEKSNPARMCWPIAFMPGKCRRASSRFTITTPGVSPAIATIEATTAEEPNPHGREVVSGDDGVLGVRPRVWRWRWTSDDREIPRLDGAG
jgi:hypothetical protein